MPKGDAKLVSTDVNRSMDDDDLGNFLAEAGLYDLMTLAHGREALPTYIRDRKAIDCMFGSEEFALAVEKIGMDCYIPFING
eukprot:15330335-Ditylum_brightwellii.AAC.1